jgi:hypothetical protein
MGIPLLKDAFYDAKQMICIWLYLWQTIFGKKE